MRARPGFRLTRQATLALLVSAAFSGAADAAPAARVDFASGVATVTGPDGRARPLARGAVLEPGDTIITGADGRAHLRFTDGAYTSLQPDTQFRIDDYRYDGRTDGQEKGFFSLLKGGLRTVTGVIGRSNKSTYRVTTPTATVGIRGTEYLLKETNSVEFHVGGGIGELFTPGRTPFLVPEGTTLSLASPTATPVLTQPPILPPKPAEGPARRGSSSSAAAGQTETQQDVAPTAPPPPPSFVAGDQTTSGGTASIVGAAGGLFAGLLAPGSGYALAFSIGGEGGFCQIGCVNSGGGFECGKPNVTLSNGEISFTQGPGYTGDFVELGPTSVGQGTTTFSGTSIGNVAAIGVLKNGTVSLQSGSVMGATFGANEGAHGFLFLPTPNMPNSGTATYTMVPNGFTEPTFSNNMGSGGLVPGGSVTSATMTANFAPLPSVSGNAIYSFPSAKGFTLSFSGNINGAGFTGSGSFFLSAGTPLGVACVSPCSANILGGFAGTANPTPPFAGMVVKVFAPGFSLNNAILLQK